VYELHGLAAPSPGPLHSFATIQTAANTASAIAYEQAPTTGLQKRIVAHVKTRYYNATSLPNPLAFGAADAKALVYEAYALALTPGLITQVFGTDVTSAILTEGGYVELAGETGQWTPSGRQLPDATKFYLPSEIRDPWGNVTTLAYDAHKMFVTTVTDPAGNVSIASYDYRVLAPSLVTDPNGNRREASFNALGLPTAEAVRGKVGATDGDTLADPTIKYTYDFLRYVTTAKPAFVKTEVREKHGAAQYGTPPGRWQTTYAYSNGSGGVAMTKAQAEPGDAPLRDASGNLVLDAQGQIVVGPVTTRWVGTGKTVLNNKGNPIKQYQPFFSSIHEFETEDELVQWGVTPLFTYDPPGRLVKTELPHGGVRRVVLDAWEETAWDENDTVSDAGNLWYAARLPGATPTPTVEEQRAATLTSAHAQTPTTTKVDAMGRPYVVRQPLTATTFLDTKTALDIEGQPLSVTDPLGRACMQYVYGVDGQLLREISIDAGTKKSLSDVAAAPLRSWDSVGHVRRTLFDTMRRPTHLYVKEGAAAEYLAQRTLYGESYPTPEVQNRRGRACITFDGAGVMLTESYDFKGNLLTSERRLATTHTTEPDWSAVASSTTPSAALTAAASLLETESFNKTFAYDAMNRAISATFPDASEVRPGYNEAGLLETIDVRVRGAGTWTAFVSGIDYDEKGRRERIEYGNGTFTEYTHDKLTFRLTRLKTARTSDSALLQNLFYTYDCVGNIVAIADTAQQTVFFNNAVVTPSADYEYDAIYRLVKASGREHAGGIADVQRDQNDVPINNLPHANDLQAVRRYEERFVYDAVGNFLEFIHDAGPGQPTGSWTRRYKYGAGTGDNSSNRLHSTSMPGDPVGGPYTATYTHDANGNMTVMPHLSTIAYTHRDQMREANLSGGGTAYYTYDHGGERVLKRIQRIGTFVEERIYLGGYEVYRKRDNTGLLLERQTLHVMDDTRRVAMVETKTVDTADPGSTGVSRLRYQYTNHLDSALLEADAAGLVISYEEYHPYGTASYQSARSGAHVSARRYRYIGNERDEETGLNYHRARYCCAWLGRWTTADPVRLRAGLNLYRYARANPVVRLDPYGMEDGPGRQAPRELTRWEKLKLGAEWILYSEFGEQTPTGKAGRASVEAAVGVATAAKEIAEAPARAVSAIARDPAGLAGAAVAEVREKGLNEATKQINPLVVAKKQLQRADQLAREGKSQEAAIERARVLVSLALMGAGVTTGPKAAPGGAGSSAAAALAAARSVASAQVGLLGIVGSIAPTTGGGDGDGDRDTPRKSEPPVESDKPPKSRRREAFDIDDAVADALNDPDVPAAVRGGEVAGTRRLGDIGPVKSREAIEHITAAGYDPADFRAVQYEVTVKGGGGGIVTVFEAEGRVYFDAHWSSANY
jgi:RHS repeat-associated protein